MRLYINRYISLRYPFCMGVVTSESYCHYVEHAFEVSIGQTLAGFQVLSGRLDDPRLLRAVYILLRRSLHAHPAGLDFYKMYSIVSYRYDVYFQMAASPVSFQNGMPLAFQQAAGYILAPLA